MMRRYEFDANRKHMFMSIIGSMLLMALAVCISGCATQKDMPVIEEHVSEVYQGNTQESYIEDETDKEVPIKSSTKEHGINQLIKFSNLAEYNGTVYQNVQLANLIQDGGEIIPVDSSSFAVAGDSIYYLTGTDWEYYTGELITYSLHCCNLDGSEDRCLLEVPECQMGYAALCGNRVVGQYYLDDQCRNFMIDMTTGEVTDIVMALAEGEYGQLLGMDDEQLYYISDGVAICRCDFDGSNKEILWRGFGDFDTVGSIIDQFQLYEGNIYTFQLVATGKESDRSDYTYQLVKFTPGKSSAPMLLDLKTVGDNNLSYQIRDNIVYGMKDNRIYTFDLKTQAEQDVVIFQEKIYGARVSYEADNCLYCVIDTEIDEKTNTDCHLVRVNPDGTYDKIASWYVS